MTIIICTAVNIFSSAEVYPYNNMAKGVIWSNNAIFPITGAIWFLQCTFVVGIVSRILYRISGKRFVPVLIVLSIVTGYIFYRNNVELPFSSDSAIVGVAMYFIGYLISNYFMKYIKKINLKYSIMFLIIGFAGIMINGSVNPRTCVYGNYILYFINALVSFIGWYRIAWYLNSRKSFPKITKLLNEVGCNSIMYLGLNQLLIIGLYVTFNIMISTKMVIVQAGRNVVIFALTIFIIYKLNKIIKGSKLDVLVGRK